jgi:hypothetical protein
MNCRLLNDRFTIYWEGETPAELLCTNAAQQELRPPTVALRLD